MIPLWRQIQRSNFSHLQALADFLELDAHARTRLLKQPRFVLNLPRRLAEKIEKNNLEDPILRQFLPLIEEQNRSEGFRLDPVEDKTFRKEKKLLHKYEGRALLICTSACAMHCRYCFRQNFPYETEEKQFEKELKAIAEDTSLTEIILSGGDPLSLSDTHLGSLMERIAEIPHVKRLRFHTRFPIGIPERLDASFLELLARARLQIVFIIHCNHPQELDAGVLAALKNVQRLGIPVLNQAVLLRGVNDNLATLKALCEKLADHGILPYYLHQLDRVQGAAHFEVPENQGLTLISELAKQLSGYAVPRYVKEIAGEPHKTPILSPSPCH